MGQQCVSHCRGKEEAAMSIEREVENIKQPYRKQEVNFASKSNQQPTTQQSGNSNTSTSATSSQTQLGVSVSTVYHISKNSNNGLTKQKSYENNNPNSNNCDDYQYEGITNPMMSGNQETAMNQMQVNSNSGESASMLPDIVIENDFTSQQQQYLLQSQQQQQQSQAAGQLQQKIRNIEFRTVVNIFYGTTKGSSSEMAAALGQQLESERFYVRLIHIEHFEPHMLVNCEAAAFILSSYGSQGGPTVDAQQFYLWLNNFDNNRTPLKNLHFAVFGLYNSSVKRNTMTAKYISVESDMDCTKQVVVAAAAAAAGATDDFVLTTRDIMQGGDDVMKNSSEQENENQFEANLQDQSQSRLHAVINSTPIKIKSMGQRIDLLLQDVGAVRLSNLSQADSAKEDVVQAAFTSWMKEFVSVLTRKYPVKCVAESIAFNAGLPYNIALKPSKEYNKDEKRKEVFEEFQKSQSMNSKPLQNEAMEFMSSTEVKILSIDSFVSEDIKDASMTCMQTRATDFTGALSSQLTNNNLSSNVPLEHTYLHINLDVSKFASSKKKSAFETGGQVQVYPKNDEESVRKLCEILEINADSWLEISDKSASQSFRKLSISDLKPPIPSPITVYTFLREFLDIHGSLKQHELYELANFVKNPVEKQTLRQLCSYASKDVFNHSSKAKPENVYSIFSVISAFWIKVPIQVLLGFNRMLQPRTYQISSSQSSNPNMISLTVRLSYAYNFESGEMPSPPIRARKAGGSIGGGGDSLLISLKSPSKLVEKSSSNAIHNTIAETKRYGVASQYFMDCFAALQKNKVGATNGSGSANNNNNNNSNEHELGVRVKLVSNCSSAEAVASLPEGFKVILICKDEGVGFVKGFLDEVASKKNEKNLEIHVYDGCRLLQSGNRGFLYEKELRAYQSSGLIKNFQVAVMTPFGASMMNTGENSCKNHMSFRSASQLNFGGNGSVSAAAANSANNSNQMYLHSSQSNNQQQQQQQQYLHHETYSFTQLSQKSNSSQISMLLENQLDKFSALISDISKADSQVRIFICGTQKTAQGIMSSIAKAYSMISKESQYAAFTSILNFESEGKICRIIWSD